ncbi:MAG: prepilin-type N-terminal cleavage/methylation domain-containing protein [Candidatus Omnitrophica bacterium]|nr:prepilin-type N-terminal cleavage/methylation domain-containing protein [Candidatus Omnitrophota bacterium]
MKKAKRESCKKNSFSLIELLIAVSIFSVISVAIYSTFSSGLMVLRRANNIDTSRQRLLLKTERIARELRQMPAFRKPLSGGLAFMVSFPYLSDHMPCRVTYFFDDSRKALMRAVEKIEDITDSKGQIEREVKTKESTVFIDSLEGFRLEYFYLDEQTREYYWRDEWPDGHMPVAVKMIITDREQEYVKTIILPVIQ